MWYMKLVETNRVPDWLIRLGIRTSHELEVRRRVSGLHYARTLRAWLEKLDRHKAEVRNVLAGIYGAD